MTQKYIPIAIPCLSDDEWHAARKPLQTGWMTQGPAVAEFEKAFAARHGVKHGIAATSCTTALHLILAALDVGPGDEVIVPAFTWIATANVVVYCGAKPVFADIDETTFNIRADEVKRLLTKKTKAIIAVHLFGLAADMDAIKAAAPGIPIVEDAACAAGGSYKGIACGALGIAGAFSFHPRKVITTGEGGMITTNDDTVADRCKILRSHGGTISEEDRHRGARPYALPEFNVLGFNYRMTDIQAAVGVVQLSKLDTFIKGRQEIADFYAREFADVKWLRTPFVPDGYEHGWQAYVCSVDESKSPMSRDEILATLEKQGIAGRPGTHCIPGLGYYKQDGCPAARHAEKTSIAIPFHNMMSKEDCARVVSTVKSL